MTVRATKPPKPLPSNGLRISVEPSIPAPAHHLPTDNRPTDPELAAVVAAWDQLPEAVRAGIVAMVKAAAGK